jgi:hypothetical protein
MNAKELRIGNAIWFDRREKVKWVNARVIADIESQSPEQPLLYSPIPLTEEWLVKFGFQKAILNTWVMPEYIYSSITLQRQKDGFIVTDLPIQIKSVHQLQNLIQALTGEELEIK